MTTVNASQSSQARAGGAPEPEVYRVRSGDTLSAIAQAHGVSLAELESANPDIHHPDLIRVGQAIHIPPRAGPPQSRPSTYTVRAGDTLSEIGVKLGVDWRVMAQANHLADPDAIRPGEVLRLAPARTPAAPSGGAAGARTPASSAPETATKGAAIDLAHAHASDAEVDRLKGYESLRLKAYPDPGTGGAPWTIGYGHTGVDVRPGQTITQAQAGALLRGDLSGAEAEVRADVKVPLGQDQFDALVSFQFNTGALGASTLLKKLNAGDYAGAQAEFGRWVHGGAGQVMPGLVTRRAQEAALFGDRAPKAAQSAPKPSPAAAASPASSLAAGRLPDTRSLSAAQRYALYAGIVETDGSAAAKADLSAGRQVVLALRVDTNTHAHGGSGAYDDRLVIVDGRTHQAHEYVASTDPVSHYEGRYGQDVDHDGRLDLGRLADGTYAFRSGSYEGHAALKPSGAETVERDTNHDGVFDARDGAHRLQTAPGASLADYVHIGGRTFTGSAGCLTLPPDQHAAFFAALHSGTNIHLVMVNTHRL